MSSMERTPLHPLSLELWAQKFDSRRRNACREYPNVHSAYTRPTFIAMAAENEAHEAQEMQEQGFCAAISKDLANPAISENSSQSEDLGATSCLAECRITPAQYLTEAAKFWCITSNFTLTELKCCLARMCSELNWDWYSQKWYNLQPHTNASLSRMWRTTLSDMYGMYCVERAKPEKTVWKWLVQKEGCEKPALEHFRIQVHNLMVLFVDVDVSEAKGDVLALSTEQERELVANFAISALSGGDIVNFLERKAESAGISYPGGIGLFEERIKTLNQPREKREPHPDYYYFWF